METNRVNTSLFTRFYLTVFNRGQHGFPITQLTDEAKKLKLTPEDLATQIVDCINNEFDSNNVKEGFLLQVQENAIICA